MSASHVNGAVTILEISEAGNHTFRSALSAYQADAAGILLDKYEMVRTLGAGGFGQCFVAKKKNNGKVVVLKKVKVGNRLEKGLMEVDLMQELQHEHIVKYYDSAIDERSRTLWIVMEFCEGGDLESYYRSRKQTHKLVEESFIWKVAYQLTKAIEACHSRRKNGKSILHRDIKPANVFLTANQDVKLGDFGLSRHLDQETSLAATFVGTDGFMAPEVRDEEVRGTERYNEKADIWSLGCVCLTLCRLKNPYATTTQRETDAMIMEIPNCYSSELVQYISSTLQIDLAIPRKPVESSG